MEYVIGMIAVVIIIVFIRIASKKEREEHCERHEAQLKQNEEILKDAHSGEEELKGENHEIKNQNNHKNNNEAMKEIDNETANIAANKDQMYRIMCLIGCTPKFDEAGSLRVEYKGRQFRFEFGGFGGMFVQIWDCWWTHITTDDPRLPIIREAVNQANYGVGPTVLIGVPTPEGLIGLHSRMEIMLHPSFPDYLPVVMAVLDLFIDTKEQVQMNYRMIEEKQMDK